MGQPQYHADGALVLSPHESPLCHQVSVAQLVTALETAAPHLSLHLGV